MRRNVSHSVRRLSAAALLAFANTAAAAQFLPLNVPGSQLVALSHDGRVAAGTLSGHAGGGFRWSEQRGAEVLSDAISVRGLSPSGRHVAGSALDMEQREVAGYWDEAGRFHALGGLPGSTAPGGILSVALSVGDDLRIVGFAYDAQDRQVAFAWTPQEGMRRVDAAPALSASQASAAPASLDCLAGTTARVLAAGCAEAAGRVDFPASGRIAGTPSLPFPQRMFAGSADDALRVGSAGEGAARVAVVWTRAEGLRPLRDTLAQGAAANGWSLMAATAVSADGRRVGGWGQHGGRFDSFIVERERPDVAR